MLIEAEYIGFKRWLSRVYAFTRILAVGIPFVQFKLTGEITLSIAAVAFVDFLAFFLTLWLSSERRFGALSYLVVLWGYLAMWVFAVHLGEGLALVLLVATLSVALNFVALMLNPSLPLSIISILMPSAVMLSIILIPQLSYVKFNIFPEAQYAKGYLQSHFYYTALGIIIISSAFMLLLSTRVDRVAKVPIYIASALSRFLPRSFLEKALISSPSSLARLKLSIFFSDIVGFTDISDSVEPEELAFMLNGFFTTINRIAEEWGGTVGAFIGDAVLVFFGEPESTGEKGDALRCVLMAIEVKKAMKELEKEWSKRGIEHPLRVRIGINTGYATVGLFGSETRKLYTAIGGQVNIAARLQQIAPAGEILISNSTFLLVKGEVLVEHYGEVEVKGISRPISTFRVVDIISSKPLGGRKQEP